jgi:hypothetical protein
MKTSDLLTLAKVRLIRTGWFQGGMHLNRGGVPNEDVPCCLLAALDDVQFQWDDTGDNWFDADNMAECIVRELIGTGRGIGLWNDAPDRTFDEVITILDKAIIVAQERENYA